MLKKILSLSLAVVMVITTLLSINVFASTNEAIATNRPDDIMPDNLYRVDYYAELFQNISAASIIVLGDYEFSSELIYDEYTTNGTLASEKRISVSNNIRTSINDTSTSRRKNDNEMRMIFVADNAIDNQYHEENARLLRNALDNGYIIFFDTDDAIVKNNLVTAIFGSDASTFNTEVREENVRIKTNDDFKSYFFISLMKDGRTIYHIVETNYGDNKDILHKSIVEHAWSNRNNINYVENIENLEEKATIQAEIQEIELDMPAIVNSSLPTNHGQQDPTALGVKFHDKWLVHQTTRSYTNETYHVNYYSHVKSRMTSRTTILLSQKALSNGRRVWANVTISEFIPNNTNTTDRPFHMLDGWWWSEIGSTTGNVRSYAPTNTPNNTTYNYGWEISATGGIEGKTGQASVTTGASYSKSFSVSNITYVTNKYTGTYTGTTFNMAFDGANHFTRNHSDHTTVTFFDTGSTANFVSIWNKQSFKFTSTNVLIYAKTVESTWQSFSASYDPSWNTQWLR
jgi:hypothetical protein